MTSRNHLFSGKGYFHRQKVLSLWIDILLSKGREPTLKELSEASDADKLHGSWTAPSAAEMMLAYSDVSCHPNFGDVSSNLLANVDGRYSSAILPVNTAISQDSVDLVAKELTSVIVLQYNKAELTANCCRSLLRHTVPGSLEIVVVDNGSATGQVERLRAEFGEAIRILEIGENRYFGEGNNIGVEYARGENIVLMNNDVAVCEGWLEGLSAELKDDVGVVGPAFLYPNGRVQEVGAFMNSDGTSRQNLKHESEDLVPAESFNCDYISAALVLLKKSVFEMVGGFDLCFEPAYYEDVDLCFKIRTYGLKTRCVPKVRVFHNENATSSDKKLKLNLGNIVDINKKKFVDRWGASIASGSTDAIENVNVIGSKNRTLGRSDMRAMTAQRNANRPRALFYSPYAMTPGGGERYVLTIAAELARTHSVVFAFPYRYSRYRLLQMGAYLGLNLDEVRVAVFPEIADDSIWDLTVVLGNSVQPPFPARGLANFYICQFPFDWRHYRGARVLHAESYHYLCYSNYVRKHIVETCPVVEGRISVVYPAVQPAAVLADIPKEALIVSVGRFFVGGHCKNQHLLIEAFRSLVSKPEFAHWRLALIGSTRPEVEHRAYYAKCVELSQGLAVEIIPDASDEVLSNYYARAAVYWHGSGLGVDKYKEPECIEHFGITPLEAASAGCMTYVPDVGGPAEIAEQFPQRLVVYDTVADLTDKMAQRFVGGMPRLIDHANSAEWTKFFSQFSAENLCGRIGERMRDEEGARQLVAGDSFGANSGRPSWYGWHASEGEFRWSDNGEPCIEFWIAGDSECMPTSLVLVFSTLGRQRVTASLNGEMVLQHEGHGPTETLTLNGSALKAGRNRLNFQLPDARMPESGDGRILALAFRRLELC